MWPLLRPALMCPERVVFAVFVRVQAWTESENGNYCL